jgi:hypothetical protein
VSSFHHFNSESKNTKKTRSNGKRGELRSLYVGMDVCCYMEKGNIFAFNLKCSIVFEMTTLEITSKQFL